MGGLPPLSSTSRNRRAVSLPLASPLLMPSATPSRSVSASAAAAVAAAATTASAAPSPSPAGDDAGEAFVLRLRRVSTRVTVRCTPTRPARTVEAISSMDSAKAKSEGRLQARMTGRENAQGGRLRRGVRPPCLPNGSRASVARRRARRAPANRTPTHKGGCWRYKGDARRLLGPPPG
eukprot:scaffold4498_cov119-Isochrysis_galbana.AAC.14